MMGVNDMKTLCLKRAVQLLVLVAWTALMQGCSTTESENRSPRPWNSPIGWESGLPSGLTEGR
jgi:hypothetical protein